MKSYQDMSITAKLLVGFAFVSLITLVVGGVGIQRMHVTNNADTFLYQNVTVPTSQLGQIKAHHQDVQTLMRAAMLTASDEENQTIKVKLAADEKLIYSLTQDFEKKITTPTMRTLFDQYIEQRKTWIPIKEKILKLALASKSDEASDVLQSVANAYAILKSEGEPIANKVDQTLDKMVEQMILQAKGIADKNTALAAGGTHTMIIVLIIGFIFAGGFGFGIARMIAMPLVKTVRVLEKVADGDLRPRLEVKSKDEVGRMGAALNKALDSIQNTLSRVEKNSQTMAASSGELSTISQQMSSVANETSVKASAVAASAEQVSRNTETVSTGVEQMNASIKEIAKNALDAARVAADAVKMTQSTNQKVAKLGDSSTEIGNIIKVINSIAEQTNLLALNATIEAARAGEAGKGFAVVANEVKELAKETAKATEDISQKIGVVQTDTKEALEAINQINAIIHRINDISNTIAGAVEEQTSTTNEISRNLTEAVKGSFEITKNIEGVAQSVRTTTTSVINAQTATQELARVAVDLQKMLTQFKIS